MFTKKYQHGLLKAGAGLVAIAGVLLSGGPAFADQEIWNDFAPWQFQGARVEGLANKYGYGSYPGTIGYAADEDYYALTCSPMPRAGTLGDPGYVANVRVSLPVATGDLDIEVFSGTGVALGGSYGTTRQEAVSVPGHYGTVNLRIYGFNHSIGDYVISYDCKWN